MAAQRSAALDVSILPVRWIVCGALEAVDGILARLLRARDGEILMRALRWIIAGSVVAAAVWVSVDLLNEAYGAGPPYYGRTTNMDKWVSPWPVLLLVDGLAAAVLIALAAPWRTKRN